MINKRGTYKIINQEGETIETFRVLVAARLYAERKSNQQAYGELRIEKDED